MQILLLGLFIFPYPIEAQTSKAENSELCNCLLKKRKTTEDYQKIDSLLSAGVELNEECVTSRRYRNVVSDGLVNAWRAVKDGFSRGKKTLRQRSYSESYKYFRPIYLAREDTALLFKLMRQGADPHLPSNDAPSVMAFFTSEDRIDILQKLIDLGADPAKMEVVYSEEKETIDFLIENGAKKENLSLEAIIEGKESTAILEAYDLSLAEVSCNSKLKVALSRKSDVAELRVLLERQLPTDCFDTEIVTSILKDVAPYVGRLSYASDRYAKEEAEALELIELFHRFDIDFNGCSNNGESPMIVAATSGSLPLVKALIDIGVSPDKGCQFNSTSPHRTPIDKVWTTKSNMDDPEEIEQLDSMLAFLEKEVFQDGKTLPQPGAFLQRGVLLPYLKAYKFDFSGIDTDKEAIRDALRARSAAEMLLLIEQGLTASVLSAAIKGNEKETLLFSVVENSMPSKLERRRKPELIEQRYAEVLQLLKVLQTKGIDFNQCGFGSDSLLGLAAVEGNLKLVKALVEGGADPNWRCNDYDSIPLEEVRKAKVDAERFRRDTARFDPIIEYLETVTD